MKLYSKFLAFSNFYFNVIFIFVEFSSEKLDIYFTKNFYLFIFSFFLFFILSKAYVDIPPTKPAVTNEIIGP